MKKKNIGWKNYQLDMVQLNGTMFVIMKHYFLCIIIRKRGRKYSFIKVDCICKPNPCIVVKYYTIYLNKKHYYFFFFFNSDLFL